MGDFKPLLDAMFTVDWLREDAPLPPVPTLQQCIDRTREPLIVALYGGPGTGKSTMATGLFHKLKLRGHNAEYVHEVAKDLTWEQRYTALAHQPLIAGKQMFKYDRLAGKVDVIVTDTSTLLGLIYRKPSDEAKWSAFDLWLVEDWRSRNTLDIFLTRSERPYNPKGRRQSEESARFMDDKIQGMLDAHLIPHLTCPATEQALSPLVNLIESRL